MLKKVSLVVQAVAYTLAGLNHFRVPAMYVAAIPSYFPQPRLLNILAGIAEIVLGVMLMLPATRRLAAWGIILMLIAFLPVHIDWIIHAPVMLGNTTISPFVAWLRIPLQVLLILWAWWYTKDENQFI